MSKHESLLRHQKIISRLRNGRKATFEEIEDYLGRQSELLAYNLLVSQRTFQRDIIEIRSLYDVDIRYDRAQKAYFIADDGSLLNSRLMEAFDLISALKMSEGLNQFINFEKRKPKGTHHFYGLLHAIRNRLTIRMVYQKFHEELPAERQVNPYGLKESRGRWYLVASDAGSEKIKSFGLDRIVDFEITKQHFILPEGFDLNEVYRYCFGVINPDHRKPEEIILSFDADQGKFIKSYPLHHSQATLADTNEELRIKLYLHITDDLIMEILSFGERAKVVKPETLAREVVQRHRESLKNY